MACCRRPPILLAMFDAPDMLIWTLTTCFAGVFAVVIGALGPYLTRPIRTPGLD
jgi:hypothetical protein